MWQRWQSIGSFATSIRSLFEPCGSWQVTQFSRPTACSHRNGPRFSAWQVAHASLIELPSLEHLHVLRAVRVVAGRALHLAAVLRADRHVRRLVHLVDFLAVALHAGLLNVCGLQLRLLRLRRVHAVAGDAADVARVVLAAGPVVVLAAVVAGRARRARLARRHRRRVLDLGLVSVRRRRAPGRDRGSSHSPCFAAGVRGLAARACGLP